MLNLFKTVSQPTDIDADTITNETLSRRFNAELSLPQAHYKSFTCLDSQPYGLIVPTKIGDKQLSDSTVNTIVEIVARKLTEVSGGATIVPQYGTWIDSKTKELIFEQNYLIYTYTQKHNRTNTSITVHRLANIIGNLLSQDSILVLIAGLPTLNH